MTYTLAHFEGGMLVTVGTVTEGMKNLYLDDARKHNWYIIEHCGVITILNANDEYSFTPQED